ncbi:MAG: DUF6273 domain-containing protein [Clostridiales Family XIII bacterium]|jgi:hypothetical protein|nr:DUF6273 domain-containing protein [Clostridiales Family XIII bacterium]
MAKSLEQINATFRNEYVDPAIASLLENANTAVNDFHADGHGTFGMADRTWRVLTAEGNFVLAISEDIVGQRRFHKASPYPGWDGSEIRAYLNDSFFNSLPFEAKALITEVTTHTARAYDDDTQSASKDKVFLLSLDEAQNSVFFGGNRDRSAHFNGTALWWWLRCPGAGFEVSASAGDTVMAVDETGALNRAYVDLSIGGLRPALWLNLNPQHPLAVPAGGRSDEIGKEP